jgi:aminoglycoside 3-N-acetyltransferase
MANTAVGRDTVLRGLRDAGLQQGDVVLVHSAMRTVGGIEGGPRAVVAALLDAIGPRGTLVAPTFTFRHEAEADPIVDPARDASEMGVLSETIRRRESAQRSAGFRHSFAAVGRRADVITQVDPALSVFDLRSSFGVMLACNAQVLLLGVTYSSSTSHHFAEWVCDVPYRRSVAFTTKLRRHDGSVVPVAMTDYQPKPSSTGTYYGTRQPDFNRLGRMLERRGRVSIAVIGNAVLRRFAMRDLIDLASVEAARDYNVFRTDEGRTGWLDFTPLDFGAVVLSPETRDGAGRPVRYQWAVLDEAALAPPRPAG